jgi:SAM-dependent methyltransferase
VTTEDAEYWARRRTSFGGGADDYAFGRPTYPLEAVEWVVPDGATRALDLGAGTGRLTERLLELSLDVVAVEPLDEMRAHVPAAARAVSGTAEAIPLGDGAVDVVVVGQAFHWFDAPVAMREIARVLRPGGRVGLMWNVFDDGEPWVDELLSVFAGDERLSNTPPDDETAPYEPFDGMSAAERRFFPHEIHYDVDRLIAYVSSRSQSILMPAEDRAAMLDRVRAKVPAAGLTMPLVCEVWRGDRGERNGRKG